MAHQANQRKLPGTIHNKERKQTISGLQCTQASLSDRLSKHKRSCEKHKTKIVTQLDKENDSQSLMIPLRVHISLSVPPSTPTAPCTTPDISDSNSENELNYIYSDHASSGDTSPTKHVSFGNRCSGCRKPQYEKPLNFSLTPSKLQSSRPSSVTHSSLSDQSSRSSTPSSGRRMSTEKRTSSIFNRRSMIRTPQGSPEEALKIRKCSQSQLNDMRQSASSSPMFTTSRNHEPKQIIKVRKSRNAFVMTKNGSIKKCTVFIPIASTCGDNSYGEYVEGREYEIEESDSDDDQLSYTQCNDEKGNIDNICNAETKQTIVRTDGDRKQNEEKLRGSHNNKIKIQEAMKSKQRKENNNTNDLHICGKLLPQNQHKHDDLTFSDVLNSLNSISTDKSTRKKISTANSAHNIRHNQPTLTKSEIKLWENQRKDLNSKQHKSSKKYKRHYKRNIGSAMEIQQQKSAQFVQEGPSIKMSQQSHKAASLLQKNPKTTKRSPRGSRRIQGTLSQYNYQTVLLV